MPVCQNVPIKKKKNNVCKVLVPKFRLKWIASKETTGSPIDFVNVTNAIEQGTYFEMMN